MTTDNEDLGDYQKRTIRLPDGAFIRLVRKGAACGELRMITRDDEGDEAGVFLSQHNAERLKALLEQWLTTEVFSNDEGDTDG